MTLILSPRTKATLLRGLKVVLAEAALAALATAWAFLGAHGTDLMQPSSLALIISVGSPLVLGAEKWIKWQEFQGDPVPADPVAIDSTEPATAEPPIPEPASPISPIVPESTDIVTPA